MKRGEKRWNGLKLDEREGGREGVREGMKGLRKRKVLRGRLVRYKSKPRDEKGFANDGRSRIELGKEAVLRVKYGEIPNSNSIRSRPFYKNIL